MKHGVICLAVILRERSELEDLLFERRSSRSSRPSAGG
jgi:hypothetical protein